MKRWTLVFSGANRACAAGGIRRSGTVPVVWRL